MVTKRIVVQRIIAGSNMASQIWNRILCLRATVYHFHLMLSASLFNYIFCSLLLLILYSDFQTLIKITYSSAQFYYYLDCFTSKLKILIWRRFNSNFEVQYFVHTTYCYNFIFNNINYSLFSNSMHLPT